MPRVSNAARYRKVELLGRWTCADSTDKVTPSGRAASASMTSQTRSTARSGYRAPSRDLSDVIAGSPPAVSAAVDARLYSDGVVVPTSPVRAWPPARACIAFLGRTMGSSPIRFENIVYSLSLLPWLRTSPLINCAANLFPITEGQGFDDSVTVRRSGAAPPGAPPAPTRFSKPTYTLGHEDGRSLMMLVDNAVYVDGRRMWTGGEPPTPRAWTRPHELLRERNGTAWIG